MDPERSYKWDVYGIAFSSGHIFSSPLKAAAGVCCVEFEFSAHPLWPESFLSGRNLARDGESPEEALVEIRAVKDRYWVRFRDGSEFRMEQSRILCHVPSNDLKNIAELDFLDAILPFHLELRGVPVLHASVVEVDGKAVLLTAQSGSGKSSFAARLVKRSAGFMSDDVAALERRAGKYYVYSGYPQLRLWKEAAEALIGSNGHETIHPLWPKRRVPIASLGRFCPQACRIAAIYALESTGSDGAIQVFDMEGHAGLMSLLTNSPVLPALGVGARAAKTIWFAELMKEVPVRTIKYPRNYDQLDRAIDVLVNDVARLSQSHDLVGAVDN